MSYEKHTISSGTSIISQNGRTVVIRGNNQSVSVINGVVRVNGKVVDTMNTYEEKIINISIEGGCGDISIDTCENIQVKGNFGTIQTHNGNVKVEGSCSGDIRTHNGNVSCGEVCGGIETHNGNISHK